jgi:hypothetical protein
MLRAPPLFPLPRRAAVFSGEKPMNKQINISLTALALGAALVSVPAFAQKASNDGGPPGEPTGAVARSTSSQSSASPYSGKPVNDGGLVQEPTQQAQSAANSKKLYNSAARPQQAAPAPAPAKVIGKPSNDGGPM